MPVFPLSRQTREQLVERLMLESAQDLIMTNHHVVRNRLQAAVIRLNRLRHKEHNLL